MKVMYDIAECAWCHTGFFDSRNLKQHEPACTKKPSRFIFSTENGASSLKKVSAIWSLHDVILWVAFNEKL